MLLLLLLLLLLELISIIGSKRSAKQHASKYHDYHNNKITVCTNKKREKIKTNNNNVLFPSDVCLFARK